MMNFLSTLSFSSPFILAALAILPGLWLLMRAAPPAPRRVRFPAIALLSGLKDEKQTPQHTPWPLMLLRLLVAAFVILALAGPMLNAPETQNRKGPIIAIVDDTFAAAPFWKTRQDALARLADEAYAENRAMVIVPTAPRASPSALTLMTAQEARRAARALKPQPFAADRTGADKALAAFLANARLNDAPDYYWLTDGLAGRATPDAQDGDKLLRARLETAELATALIAPGESVLALSPDDAPGGEQTRSDASGGKDALHIKMDRIGATPAWRGALIASARDGRLLARTPVAFAIGETRLHAEIVLPLALRNDLASIRIETISSAGAVHLADARERRAGIGLVDSGDIADSGLLDGAYYVEKALAPYAAFQRGALEELLAGDVSVIVLDDVGRLRAGVQDKLTAWIESGGVLVRFAGDNLAEAAQDEVLALTPAPLRGGGRAFGGALSWDTPQSIGAFHPDGPFARLALPGDVKVRRQVLANPGAVASDATWASLKDGTPIVTGARRGAGAIVLFHVTATPAWSDLPLSGAFIDMLRRLSYLSVLSPNTGETDADARYAPLRVLDGFGALQNPAPDLPSAGLDDLEAGPAAQRPPGLYGAPDTPLAVNAIHKTLDFKALNTGAITRAPYENATAKRLAPPLFALAFLLLLIDGLATLFLAGRLRPRQVQAAAALILIASVGIMLAAPPAHAQPLDPPIDEKAETAALSARLAFVRTGDPDIDRLSESGLAALSRELFRRTAVEPASPVGIDPETDVLSVYPFLYWPIAAGAPQPSEDALANIEEFMRGGGLILFDTRDDERALSGLETPERRALRDILSQLDIPPLSPLPEGHVLTRSFYLLKDLNGRTQNNPVWVQTTGAANDAVTPLIIGGRDWAGAWSADEFGRPLLPLGRGGLRGRELAYRAGVNIVMVAFTGNYKSDQVHMPILLKRLGQ